MMAGRKSKNQSTCELAGREPGVMVLSEEMVLIQPLSCISVKVATSALHGVGQQFVKEI